MTFKRKATPVAVLAVAALALTACAQSDRDDSGSDTGSSSGSEGGNSTFTFGAAGAPKVFDPFYATDGETFRVTRQIHQGLLGVGAGPARAALALDRRHLPADQPRAGPVAGDLDLVDPPALG